MNRVQSQVRKTLVLCYVEVPPPNALPSIEIDATEEKQAEGEVVDIGKFFKQYKVRELVVKRWIPNRERD